MEHQIAATAAGHWSISVGFLSDRGRRRPINEDAQSVYLPYRGEASCMAVDAFFAVADGMGGHEAGDVASRAAVDAAERGFIESTVVEPDSVSDLPARIERVFQQINQDLIRLAEANYQVRGMGTTLTLALVRGQTLYLGHIGDSRCYRLRDGVLEQLTEDHSWVAEQLRAGVLTPEEAARHPERNLITQCLGVDPGLEVFLREEAVALGDRYLLCSDGLHGQVDDETLRRVLLEESDAQTAGTRLVELANAAGGRDNITVVVFDLAPSASAPAAVPTVPVPIHVENQATLPTTLRRGLRRALARGMVLSGLLPLIGAASVGAWLHFAGGRTPTRPQPVRVIGPAVERAPAALGKEADQAAVRARDTGTVANSADHPAGGNRADSVSRAIRSHPNHYLWR